MYLLKAKVAYDKEALVEYEACKKELRKQRKARRRARHAARAAANEGLWHDLDFNCKYMGTFRVRFKNQPDFAGGGQR